MKTLIFSDTHLTDRFEEKQYTFLSNVIRKSDRVIIIGDFWEGYITTFDRFLASPWQRLFPLLKSKKTVYLFGNHDRQNYMDSRMNLFSDIQSETFQLPFQNKILHFEHGNRIQPFFDEKLHLKRVPPFIANFLRILGRFMVRHFLKIYLESRYQKDNKSIKQKLYRNIEGNEVLVCGHTHAAETDWGNRFLNSGFINHGLGQYFIIEDERIIFHEHWYDKP